MPMEEKKLPGGRHSLSLLERESLTVTAVEEVLGFDEQEVTVRTARGQLTVRGSGLKVERLDKMSAELALSGEVSELIYAREREKGGFWARLLS